MGDVPGEKLARRLKGPAFFVFAPHWPRGRIHHQRAQISQYESVLARAPIQRTLASHILA